MAPRNDRNTVIVDRGGYWVTDSSGAPVAWMPGPPPQGATVSQQDYRTAYNGAAERNQGVSMFDRLVQRSIEQAQQGANVRQGAQGAWDAVPHWGGQEVVQQSAQDAVGGIAERIAQLMGMGGGGGGGNVSLPRMTGPSDAEIAAMVNQLVTAAAAPYQAARGDLARQRDTNSAAGRFRFGHEGSDTFVLAGDDLQNGLLVDGVRVDPFGSHRYFRSMMEHISPASS